MGRACNNPECSSSTGIHEGMTFGWGTLDSLGYWEHPCRVCAADWDAHIKEKRAEVLAQITASFKGDEAKIRDYMAHAQWLRYPAWPFATLEIGQNITGDNKTPLGNISMENAEKAAIAYVDALICSPDQYELVCGEQIENEYFFRFYNKVSSASWLVKVALNGSQITIDATS